MELKNALDKYGIVGIANNYESKMPKKGKVTELNIKNIHKALKIVGLNDTYLEKNIEDLSKSEKWKIELATKLQNDVIMIGNLSNSLINKDIVYIKKVLLKIHKDFHKKIIVVDKDINVFIDLVKMILLVKNNKIIYYTNDYYDDMLYEFLNMPKIVEFVKYCENEEHYLIHSTDIHELIKDIYRRVS